MLVPSGQIGKTTTNCWSFLVLHPAPPQKELVVAEAPQFCSFFVRKSFSNFAFLGSFAKNKEIADLDQLTKRISKSYFTKLKICEIRSLRRYFNILVLCSTSGTSIHGYIRDYNDVSLAALVLLKLHRSKVLVLSEVGTKHGREHQDVLKITGSPQGGHRTK